MQDNWFFILNSHGFRQKCLSGVSLSFFHSFNLSCVLFWLHASKNLKDRHGVQNEEKENENRIELKTVLFTHWNLLCMFSAHESVCKENQVSFSARGRTHIKTIDLEYDARWYYTHISLISFCFAQTNTPHVADDGVFTVPLNPQYLRKCVSLRGDVCGIYVRMCVCAHNIHIVYTINTHTKRTHISMSLS